MPSYCDVIKELICQPSAGFLGSSSLCLLCQGSVGLCAEHYGGEVGQSENIFIFLNISLLSADGDLPGLVRSL